MGYRSVLARDNETHISSLLRQLYGFHILVCLNASIKVLQNDILFLCINLKLECSMAKCDFV